MNRPPDRVIADLFAALQARRDADPATSYTAALYAKGPDAILKKLGEEAAESIIAAKDMGRTGDAAAESAALVHELADLWFHSLALLAAYDLSLEALTDELARRSGRSGLEEKASRPKT